jgi:16S rRNA (cytosine967-C5)-methyltransferase
VAQHSARRAALLALRNWRTEHRLSDTVISSLLAESRLGSSDRAFALELFYGVLRHLSLLDFWISRLRSGTLEPDLRDVVRLGLYQLSVLDVPEHAAVYETVQLASARHRGLINAVLRSATRRREELQTEARKQPLAVQTSHPQFLLDRWSATFGAAEMAALCAWNNKPPPLYARVNTLKMSLKEFPSLHPEARPLAGRDGFVEFPGLFPHEAVQEGQCYIQDPSTALACDLLEPQPGEIILDACAAPGGKTCMIAGLMKNEGTLIACDRDPQRLQVLEENLTRLGVTMARSVRHDWRPGSLPGDLVPIGSADRILVDAPCSNTGVMRRRVDVRWRLQPAEFKRMQEQQVSIVRSVVPFLKPAGVLVYSTCSLEPEENRRVVERIVSELHLRVEDERDCLPFRDGFDGAYAARLKPELQ